MIESGDSEWDAGRAAKRRVRASDIESGFKTKIRVDRQKLEAIVPIIHFFCVWDSSVSRDQAIKGSDIDGGLIVIAERDRTKEDLIIAELQAQGFKVSHADSSSQGDAIDFMSLERFNKIKANIDRYSRDLDIHREVGVYKD